MNKPRSLRDQRRADAREALYRAERRRDEIIFSLVQNDARIRKLRRKLTRLDMHDAISKLPLSVAEGKLLDRVEIKTGGDLNDDISDIPWREMTGADL